MGTMVEVLEKLVKTPGLPGREEKVAGLIRSYLSSQNCEISQDRLGNLIAHFPGNGPRLMVMAHMDEVGFIVQRILPNGFLRIERVGGGSIQSLPGSWLDLWVGDDCLPVSAGVLPYHLSSAANPPELKDIFLDIGVSSQSAAVAMGVRPGQMLTWHSPLRHFGENLISAKALDDRLGCAVLIQLAERFSSRLENCDLYLAFIVQEELMLMGANPVVHQVQPDILIGVDGTLSFDTPDLEGMQCDLRLGNGPAIKWMDAIRGKMPAYVPNMILAEHARNIASQQSIPLQDEIITGISTVISSAVYAGNGAASVAFSLPIRYHHTPIETANLVDANNLVNLLESIIMSPLPAL